MSPYPQSLNSFGRHLLDRTNHQNFPAELFVVALVVASIRRDGQGASERFLSWILLLPIGVTSLWAGASHVFFPAMAARFIGWQVSPFQFEVGMADFAIGVTACISFWRDLEFKAAGVFAASIFCLETPSGIFARYFLQAISRPGMRACLSTRTWPARCCRSSCSAWRRVGGLCRPVVGSREGRAEQTESRPQ
jgi:hypothetical protein